MKTRQYCVDPWLPQDEELLLMERPIPPDCYPERLDPLWVYEKGARKGQPLAGAQLVSLGGWDKVLSDKGIGGHLLNPKTREFYLQFRNDIVDRIVPEIVRPDVNEKSTLEKLINFMKEKLVAPAEVLTFDDDQGLPDIRQLQPFRKPYSGKYVAPKETDNGVYLPEPGDSVVVKVESYDYNPRGVPELGTVLAVSECKNILTVNWWWTGKDQYLITDDFYRIAKRRKNYSSEVEVTSVVFYGINLINGTKKGTKKFNRATLTDLRTHMVENDIDIFPREREATISSSSDESSEFDSDDDLLLIK